MPTRDLLAEHAAFTRRWFLRLATAAVAGQPIVALADMPPGKELARALEKLEPYFTAAEDFRDVSRGKPLPHSLPDAKKREVGLTRETWGRKGPKSIHRASSAISISVEPSGTMVIELSRRPA